MGTESSGGYTITFDKNTFLSLGVDVYGKSENLNEEKKRKKARRARSIRSLILLTIRSMNLRPSTKSLPPVAMYQEKSILNLKAVIFGKAPSERTLTTP